MKRKLFNLLALTLLIALVAPSASMAQPGKMGTKGKHAPMMMKQANSGMECQIPNLTDDQKKKIEALKTPHMKKMQQMKLDMKLLQVELKKLTTADKPDSDAIDAKVDEISTQQNKMMKAGMKHRMDIRALLTDDQKIFFDTHGGKGPGMHGMGPGHKPACQKEK